MITRTRLESGRFNQILDYFSTKNANFDMLNYWIITMICEARKQIALNYSAGRILKHKIIFLMRNKVCGTMLYENFE
ncbi:hypothetical protein BpHYR1_032432, partial [Brachionus plicatilis]